MTAKSLCLSLLLGAALVPLWSHAEHRPPARTAPKESMKPPASRTEAIVEKRHGVEVADPFRWLEDVKSPEVQAWMQAQDAFARAALAELPGRSGLAARLRELAYMDAVSAPRSRGGRLFYSRTHKDKEKAIYYWRQGKDGAERVLLDPNELAKKEPTALGVVSISYDGRKAAFTLKPNNGDEAILHVMDVESGKWSSRDVIPGAKYAHPVWTPDSGGFYYIRVPVDSTIPVAERPGFAEARLHRLETDPATDPVVHARTGDPKTFLGIDHSRDGRWLFATVEHGWNRTDVWFQETRLRQDPARGWRKLVAGVDARFEVVAWKDAFWVFTNDGAPRGQVFRVDPNKPERAAWRAVLPEYADGTVMEAVQLLGNHLVVSVLRNASNALDIWSLDGRKVGAVALPGLGSVTSVVGEPDADEAYVGFNSFARPPEIRRFSVGSGKGALWNAVTLPGLPAPDGPSPWNVEQVWYPSKDGTKVSMFLVTRKGTRRDGSTPFVMYGYGGFLVTMAPYFQASLIPWLEAGGGYALPNLRGGGEYGERWHRDGMRDKKQNVFDDFVAAAEYLVREGWTRPERLGIRGGSNGGLLVGAAMTQRPDLFKAVVCQVPLLDMVRYTKFGSGKTWIEEYGDPDVSSELKYLKTYSPYHRVRAGVAYPALLVASADTDDRVDPMHARKFTAAIQAASSRGPTSAWLRIERNAGHGGADMVKQAVELGVDIYVFFAAELGLRLEAGR